MWFEISDAHADKITSNADPFVLGILLTAMETGNDIIINSACLSSGLIINLDKIQQHWHNWKPERYRKIKIFSTEIESNVSHGDGSICAFTGGVDSTQMLFDLVHNINKPPISAAIFVHGFHIPLHIDPRPVIEHLNVLCNYAGVPLILVRSNLRGFGLWDDIHGLAVGACLTLFSKVYNVGFIASSHPSLYPRYPWGSNSITDPLMSSKAFLVRNYGAHLTRTQKMIFLKEHPLFFKHLVVCTRDFLQNCGKCEKCIRTMLGARLVDMDVSKSFAEPQLYPHKVLTLRASLPWEIKDYTDLYHWSRRLGKKNIIFKLLWLNIQLNRTIFIIRPLNMSILSFLKQILKRKYPVRHYSIHNQDDRSWVTKEN